MMFKFLIVLLLVLFVLSHEDFESIKCTNDDFCPVFKCAEGTPCPKYICENYRCKQIVQRPSNQCHILNSVYCVDDDTVIVQVYEEKLTNYCYDRFGICKFKNGKCRWGHSWDFNFCLHMLGE